MREKELDLREVERVVGLLELTPVEVSLRFDIIVCFNEETGAAQAQRRKRRRKILVYMTSSESRSL